MQRHAHLPLAAERWNVLTETLQNKHTAVRAVRACTTQKHTTWDTRVTKMHGGAHCYWSLTTLIMTFLLKIHFIWQFCYIPHTVWDKSVNVYFNNLFSVMESDKVHLLRYFTKYILSTKIMRYPFSATFDHIPQHFEEKTVLFTPI